MRAIVHPEHLPDDSRIPAEAALPVFVAEDEDGRRPLRLVGVDEAAPVHRRDAERVEEIRRHDPRRHTLRFGTPEQREEHVVKFDEVAERAGLSIIDDVLRGEPDVVRDRVPLSLAEHDDAVAVAEGKRPQQHAVDDAENRAVRAYPQRHRQHHDEGESRIAPEIAHAVADILRGGFEKPRQPRIAHVILDAGNGAEDAQRGPACLQRRHARFQVLIDEHVEVVLELDVELLLETLAAEERFQTNGEMADHACGLPFMPRGAACCGDLLLTLRQQIQSALATRPGRARRHRRAVPSCAFPPRAAFGHRG